MTVYNMFQVECKAVRKIAVRLCCIVVLLRLLLTRDAYAYA